MKNFLKEELAELIVKVDDLETAKGFLKNMLTESEVEEFSIRLQIFKKLKEGISHRKIASSLEVSISTVSRGSKELKYNNTKFLELL